MRWWRCRPQAFQRRIKSRRRRKPHNLSPQVGWLLVTVLNELLLGHHLDALCALLVLGLSETSRILRRHFDLLTWSSSRQQACAACISLPCMPTLCSSPYASGLPSPATYPRLWFLGVRHRLLGLPLVGPIWLPIHHPRSGESPGRPGRPDRSGTPDSYVCCWLQMRTRQSLDGDRLRRCQ